MANELRATANARYKRTNAIIIVIIALLTCFALVMAVYNLIKGGYLFTAAWFIAAILAGTYVIIRVNTVFATAVMTDKVNLYMKNWSNDFLPYDYNNKIKILSEFIPAKTKIIEIPLNEISLVIIGTKNYIKRNLGVESDSDFIHSIRALENSKDFYRKRTISSMDMMYVETYDNECYYMPVVQYDTKSMVKILTVLQRANPDVVIKSGSRAYRRLVAETR